MSPKKDVGFQSQPRSQQAYCFCTYGSVLGERLCHPVSLTGSIDSSKLLMEDVRVPCRMHQFVLDFLPELVQPHIPMSPVVPSKLYCKGPIKKKQHMLGPWQKCLNLQKCCYEVDRLNIVMDYNSHSSYFPPNSKLSGFVQLTIC